MKLLRHASECFAQNGQLLLHLYAIMDTTWPSATLKGDLSTKSMFALTQIPLRGMPAGDANNLIESILCHDVNPKHNFATFSTTSFDHLPTNLLYNTIGKNMSNQHEYQGVTSVHRQCMSMLAKLWHGGGDDEIPVGTSTSGSSEALMLGCLAFKRQWTERQKERGADRSCPNIVFSSGAHVVCAKFANYFDVEARIIPVGPETDYTLHPEAVKLAADDNTIGVVVVLGSTLTGRYENVKQIADVLDEIHFDKGLDIPIHVDAASGGLVAPFIQPSFVWDFRLRRVHSINVSSHKFGLVPTSLGWIVWRDSCYLPQDMVFDVDYLDQSHRSWTLSFSKPSFPVVLQYYHFIQNGFHGTAKIISTCMDRARRLSWTLEKSSWFKCVSNIHELERFSKSVPRTGKEENTGTCTANGTNVNIRKNEEFEPSTDLYCAGLPVVAFAFSDTFQSAYPGANLISLSQKLRKLGYSVPYSEIHFSRSTLGLLRIVIRPDIDEMMIERVIEHITDSVEKLYLVM